MLVQGLGLVVTGTLPVFNLTEDSSDRKVGDCGCHRPGCTGTPSVGARRGGEGSLMLGAWLQGVHQHPGALPALHPLPEVRPGVTAIPTTALASPPGSVGSAGSCKSLRGAVSHGGLPGGWHVLPCAPAVSRSNPHIPGGRSSPPPCFPVPVLAVAGDSPAPTRLPPCTSFQNQLILGVMGIDVALNDIKRLTPRYNVRGGPFPSVPALRCPSAAWERAAGSPRLHPPAPRGTSSSAGGSRVQRPWLQSGAGAGRRAGIRAG